MNFQDVIIIAIALAMDAFGVVIGIGVNSSLQKKHKIKFVISFTFFQFLFAYIGGIFGYLFDIYITSIPQVVGGIIMAAIGTLMILDGLKEKENDILIKNSTCIILGISVSIDAFVIGFTAFHVWGISMTLFINCIFIGLVTAFMCTLGFILCRYIKKLNFISKYANFFGGAALIFFGLKMILG